MDAMDNGRHLRAGQMRWCREVEQWRDARHPREKEGGEELVEVLLRGKAPWGFTLRGGSEHREPLVITKVEEGSAAAAVRLRAGDEMVSVNAVPLSGSRQEAICLVKRSHKSLSLVVRRKNEPSWRPHSWHSSKLTEEDSETTKGEVTSALVWQPKHEARPKDSSFQGDQNSQRLLTSQLSSMNNMEKLERPAHPYPPGRLSPTKYTHTTESPSGPGGKRDTGFSCLSSSSSPPVHDPCTLGRKVTSIENIFFKGLQNEGSFPVERPRYLQPSLGTSGWEGSRLEEQPPSRASTLARSSVGPVWQVPEKKKSQSPPPPLPPLRSDSFVATKVFPYCEGSDGPTRNHGRSVDKQTEYNNLNGVKSQPEKTSEVRRSFNPLPTKDFLHPNTAADHNHHQLHPNKHFSLSSSDIRPSHYTHLPAHQRQYSDESPFYLQTRSTAPTKIQSVGSYYRSLQDLPSKASSRKLVHHSTASVTGSAANPNLENGAHNRYYSLASKQSVQTSENQARQGTVESRRGDTEKTHWVNSNEQGFPSSSKTNMKAKYSLPHCQMPYSENKERNGHCHSANGLHYDHHPSEVSVCSRSPEDPAKRSEGHTNAMKILFPTHQSNDHKVGLSKHHDPWVPQEDHRISPLKTPLLHSLTQERKSLAERQPTAMTTSSTYTQDVLDTVAASSGKANRRSDRYATTLRNEIKEKRAQLQKSRSAATLTCDAEDEEAEEWKSTETLTSSGVFSYKDHLKEAQARVLQATSFQRRDLEPLGPETTVGKTSNGRIRGRKRFPLAKRTHSFSEPDKIDKVGVEGGLQTGSFGERRKFFEAKPTFSKPVPKSSQTPDIKETISQAHSSVDPKCPSLGCEQVLLEQQRLGTFAEYQATWNKQKKSSEVKTQGRYHSAENILDADSEEKAVCIHERSRSSPSADFYTQNIPSTWRDPKAKQNSDSTRGKSESRQQHPVNHSPQSAPSAPRHEGPGPGLSDHRTKSNAADPSCRLSPNPGSQHPAQPSQIKGLLSPPRPHIGLETTSSTQEFLSGAQADPSELQPVSSSSSDTQGLAPAQSPTLAGSPTLCRMLEPDMNKGGVESEDKSQRQPAPSSPPSPLSSWTASLALPVADGARSPSPQFSPLRLTDKPPVVSVQDDSPLRSESESKLAEVMDGSSSVRKVPVRIVHSESSLEREGQAYLPQNSETCGLFKLLPFIPSLGDTESSTSSLFNPYCRRPAQDPGRTSTAARCTGSPESSSLGAQSSEEDAKREELARDIMCKDKSLADILNQIGRKTTMDLMEGLFPPEDQILEGAHQRRRASAGSRLLTTARREEEDVSGSAAASLVPTSSYYNTSAPKAELLIKMKDMQEQLEEQDSEDELDVDLASKKQELISSLARKLEVLREARQSLQEDVEDNEALGREVEATVQRLCQPNQLDKFRMFVGDLDKVVSLLLSLSGRLARVENALNSLEDEAPPEEKRTLMEKRKLLMRQYDDAKELKENLDRREHLVSGIMEAHLDPESLDDYRHFVKMKSALIIEQRKLEDKIKLGEEQLKCLVDSLPLEQRSLL
ncbi:protein Shroom2-like [Aulostomus maculatus]